MAIRQAEHSARSPGIHRKPPVTPMESTKASHFGRVRKRSAKVFVHCGDSHEGEQEAEESSDTASKALQSQSSAGWAEKEAGNWYMGVGANPM